MGKKVRDPDLVAMGKRIRMAREGRQLTRDQLSEAAGISSQFLAQVEKGEQSMTALPLKGVVQALKVSADYLLLGNSSLGQRVGLAAEYLSSLTPVQRELLAETVFHMEGVLKALEPEHE